MVVVVELVASLIPLFVGGVFVELVAAGVFVELLAVFVVFFILLKH